MRLLFLLLLFTGNAAAAPTKECVQIFYDRSPDPTYWMGKTYATFLQNLLGHFPEFQQIISPIELYKKGEIENCRATFYLGSYFDNKIPADFLVDYQKTQKSVVWFGYSIWQMGEAFEQIFGYRYDGLTTLDKQLTDEKGHPTFFKWITYKGETFFKFGDWSLTNPQEFLAPFEQIIISKTRSGDTSVLSTARHSGREIEIPYAIRNKNHFYVADIPFSYMHEADRYLITTDLLFDILKVEPKHKKRLALLRIEDVHALLPLYNLYGMTNVLIEEKVPINISLIPIFFDPLYVYARSQSDEYVTMDRKIQFVEYLREMQKLNASFIWHGVTHQTGRRKNPHNGASGDDFEFWLSQENRPLEKDSASWVLDRLNDGFYTIMQTKLAPPLVWLTPHYQASALDYLIFARVFPWNVGRVIYFEFQAHNLPAHDPSHWFSKLDPTAQKNRIDTFSKISIKNVSQRWNGQFFPYEIHGDIYGQRIIPENLGNSQPYISEHVLRTRTAKEIVQDAKRNLVIRDAWASFFYHPYLLQPFNSGGRGAFPGDPKELRYIVREIKKLGYTFINAHQFAEKNTNPIRPEPIYREIQQ